MNILFHKRFLKQQERLSRALQVKLSERIELFAHDAFSQKLNNHELHHPYEGCRSINISGDVRAIYKIENGTCTFLYVSTHSQLYK